MIEATEFFSWLSLLKAQLLSLSVEPLSEILSQRIRVHISLFTQLLPLLWSEIRREPLWQEFPIAPLGVLSRSLLSFPATWAPMHPGDPLVRAICWVGACPGTLPLCNVKRRADGFFLQIRKLLPLRAFAPHRKGYSLNETRRATTAGSATSERTRAFAQILKTEFSRTYTHSLRFFDAREWTATWEWKRWRALNLDWDRFPFIPSWSFNSSELLHSSFSSNLVEFGIRNGEWKRDLIWPLSLRTYYLEEFHFDACQLCKAQFHLFLRTLTRWLS